MTREWSHCHDRYMQIERCGLARRVDSISAAARGSSKANAAVLLLGNVRASAESSPCR